MFSPAYMKRPLVLIVVTIALYLHAGAQGISKDKERRHSLKINLLSPLASTLNLAFETQTAKDCSFQLGMAYMNHSTYDETDGLTNAFFVTPEFRFELTKTKGGYAFVGAFARYINMQYSRTERRGAKHSTAQYESLGVGLLVGQRFVYRNVLAIEIFAGPVYSWLVAAENNFYNRGNTDIVLDDIPYSLLKRYGLRAGVTLGWMF